MAWLLSHDFGRTLLDHFAGIHHSNVISEIARGSDVMGDIQHGKTAAITQVTEKIQNPKAHRDVKHRYGLVGQEGDRSRCKRTRNCDSLPLSTRQLVRAPTKKL
jgi:hypothetical protein